MEDTKNLYAKLNVIRLELSKEMNKSGKNNYSKYDYFQLKDFMPKAIDLCNANGVFTKFWIDEEKRELKKNTTITNRVVDGDSITTEESDCAFEYIEYAYLEVTDIESGEIELFKKRTANVNVQGAQPIQNLGGKSTYMKRYMYMDVFEINENDTVEENTGKPIKAEPKIVEATKPTVKKVETKVAEKEVAPKVEVQEKVEAEAPKENVDTSDLMTMETKLMIAGKIKEAGLDPRNEIIEFAKELGTDVPLLKESDKEEILKILEKKIGGKDNE